MSASSLKTLVAESITTAVETMSSLQIVELINLERSLTPGAKELRHDNFMAKVPEVLGGGALRWKGSYRTSQNKQLPCYNFPRRETMLMLMSYSYDLQAAVYDRMTELESQRLKVPQTFAEALRLAADTQEQLAEAVRTKAEIGNRREATAMSTASQATRKAKLLERELVGMKGRNMHTPTIAARMLGFTSAVLFNRYLAKIGYQRKDGVTGQWVPTKAGKPHCAMREWTKSIGPEGAGHKMGGQHLAWDVDHLAMQAGDADETPAAPEGRPYDMGDPLGHMTPREKRDRIADSLMRYGDEYGMENVRKTAKEIFTGNEWECIREIPDDELTFAISEIDSVFK